MGLIKDIIKERTFALQLFGAILFIVYLFLAMLTTLEANAVCLAHGYPNAKVTLLLQAYCYRVENGSTVVVKVEDVMGRKNDAPR